MKTITLTDKQAEKLLGILRDCAGVDYYAGLVETVIQQVDEQRKPTPERAPVCVEENTP